MTRQYTRGESMHLTPEAQSKKSQEKLKILREKVKKTVDVQFGKTSEQSNVNKEKLSQMVDELGELMKVIPPYCNWDDEARQGAIDSWRKALDEFLENEWKRYILDNYHELSPKFSTGSNSGSLIGFTNLRGLTPLGQIMSEHPEQVPYSGELFVGISEGGINQNALSFTSDTRTAISYAKEPTFNTMGWNPQISEQRVINLKAKIDEMEKSPASSSDKWKGRDLPQEALEAFRLNVKIEERRQYLYLQLSEMERLFVVSPFPVVYGILKTEDMNEGNYEEFKGGIQGEFTHSGHLSIDDNGSGQFVLYCPAEKYTIVREYLKEKNISISVHPLEAVKECTKINKLSDLVNRLRKKKQEMKKITKSRQRTVDF